MESETIHKNFHQKPIHHLRKKKIKFPKELFIFHAPYGNISAYICLSKTQIQTRVA